VKIRRFKVIILQDGEVKSVKVGPLYQMRPIMEEYEKEFGVVFLQDGDGDYVADLGQGKLAL